MNKRPIRPLNILFSFILAIIVWAYVDDRRVETQVFEIPIMVEIPSGWENRSNFPESVTASLRGPKELMKGLSPNDLTLQYTVSRPSSESDSHTEPILIAPSDIRIPAGVEVVDISNKEISVSLVRLVPYYLRIKVNIAGEPSAGYRVTSAYPDPNWIKILVPKGTLSPGDELETYPIDITNSSKSIYRRVGIKPSVLSNRLIASDADTLVSVVIDPLPQKKVFKNVPVRILYSLLGLTLTGIEPATVDLHLEGPQAQIEKMTEQTPIVYADLREITGQPQGRHTLQLKTQLPPDIQLTQINPGDVTIRLVYDTSKTSPTPASSDSPVKSSDIPIEAP